MGRGTDEAVKLFFASAGRLGRLPFIGGIAVVVALFALYERAVRGPAHFATAWLVHLVLVFTASCLLSKRLHDRGRSGWWTAVLLLAFAIVWPAPEGLIDWLFVVPLVWAAVDLAAMPGQPRPNRFGPPV
jgi:uncharacterized membrane protein YhaH (DUF805 family)